MCCRLDKLILEAISNLKEPNGSDRASIASYIEVLPLVCKDRYFYFADTINELIKVQSACNALYHGDFLISLLLQKDILLATTFLKLVAYQNEKRKKEILEKICTTANVHKL